MRILLLLCALAMPTIAWLSQTGSFGPDNGTISDRYPTLLVSAGYAFSIWGLIFLLDVAFGVLQLRRRERGVLDRIRPAAIGGFALTALWMPVFSQQVFWLALLVIWAGLACLLYCAVAISRDPDRPLWAWLPLSLHAGWLSLAAFLNLAQVIVAYELLPTDAMLAWSAVLLVAAATLLLLANARMHGNWAFVAAAVWGLVATWIKQSGSTLAGAGTAAGLAIAIVALLAAQTAWLRLHGRERDRIAGRVP